MLRLQTLVSSGLTVIAKSSIPIHSPIALAYVNIAEQVMHQSLGVLEVQTVHQPLIDSAPATINTQAAHQLSDSSQSLDSVAVLNPSHILQARVSLAHSNLQLDSTLSLDDSVLTQHISTTVMS
ncbi:hypothetical protein ACH5RR_021619 [Cinchona calisaya]|uniref:Uncharacterized protein n=1 Tax=Cinchona calisaya TaxID=153742 RepID=A0ABD2ZLD5_9GENT